MGSFYVLFCFGYALCQQTIDEDLTDVEQLTNNLELLTENVIDLNMQLKQVW